HFDPSKPSVHAGIVACPPTAAATGGCAHSAQRDSRASPSARKCRLRLRIRGPLWVGDGSLPKRGATSALHRAADGLVSRGGSGHGIHTRGEGHVTPSLTSVPSASPLLVASGLHVSFGSRTNRVDALRGVSLSIARGEVLAVVGESGSGKSTLARSLIGMVRAQRGALHLGGEAVPLNLASRTLSQRRRIGMVFQDSAAAFDPRFTVERILNEPVTLLARRGAMLQGSFPTTAALLDRVGLPASVLGRRPHELSGGQRQRVGIARALAGEPQLLICDEAVSALDVSVQAQILNLIADLQCDHGLSILFITHDLSVVSYLADRIAVMVHGELIETGDAAQILDAPEHPYTRRLLDAGMHDQSSRGVHTTNV
ncbi:MAG TPA: ABC transporter ATP-binding protein, partial [Paraburkholderia sp.]|nr:ABC transporter ATP-binding protein [Paraburkholderia sp.]